MARSKLNFAVRLKLASSTRLQLGVGRLAEAFTEPGLISDPMLETMEHLAEIAQTEATVQSRSRGVAREIMSDVSPFLARVKIPLAYGPTLNRGRAKGAKMPPPDALKAWADANHYEGSLFVLARSIQRRGTKGRFFMRKARAAVRRAMTGEVSRLEGQIERRFEARV